MVQRAGHSTRGGARKEDAQKRSLFALLSSLPGLLIELVKSELEQLKTELVRKAKHAGIGIGLMVVAAVFAFFATGVLVAAAILGLAVVLPGWLAAIIVAVALLIVTAILILVGVKQLQRGTPAMPSETIESVQQDVRVIKGTEKRGTVKRGTS
ncbi:MAG: phage holin family protein [Terrimesophilobacter sp.]